MQHSLRSNLLSSYAILVLGILLVGGWSVYNFAVLGRSVRRIMANNYRSVLDAQVMKETLERQDSALIFHASGHTAKAHAQYEQNRLRFAEHLADAAANITETGEPEIIDAIQQQFDDYSQRARQYLAGPSDRRANRAYFADFEPAFLQLKTECQRLLDLNQQAMVNAQRRAEDQSAAATRTAIAVAVGTMLLGMVYSLNLSRRLVSPLVALTNAARRIGQGDLAQQISISTHDEVEVLGEEFNRMAGNLRVYREREAARLHVAEQQAEAAISSLYEPIVVTDADGNLAGLNRAAERLFGSRESWLGKPVEQAGVETLSRSVRLALEEARPIAPEGPGAMAEVVVDQYPRSYRLRTSPLLQSTGEPSGTVTVLEDLTREREIDQLKDEFISVASHELRTPLTSLHMAVQLLAEGSAGKLNEKQERLVRMAASDAERLDRLTRDLLDLTRLEAGTSAPIRNPVPPLEIVELGLAPLRTGAAEKGIALSTEVDENLPEVAGDVGQLARVIRNLGGNAVRHTAAGGTVVVSAHRHNGSLQFDISDTGEGIPAEYLPRIFDRFVQVPGATSGGAGLGLPIAKKIVESHGGTIWADSNVGQGTQMHFTLPIAEGHIKTGQEEERSR